MKRILKYSATSIGIALAIFCTIGVFIDISHRGNFSLSNYSFTQMVLGTLITGIGFGAPAIVYDNENLPFSIQTVIHMGIGCIVYTITAFCVGWIPTELSIGKCLLIVFCELAVSFLIWFCFQLHYKKTAKKMNDKIREIVK